MHSVFPGFPFLSVCQLSDLIGRKSWLVGCLFGIVSLCSTFQLCVVFVAFSSALSCRGLIFFSCRVLFPAGPMPPAGLCLFWVIHFLVSRFSLTGCFHNPLVACFQWFCLRVLLCHLFSYHPLLIRFMWSSLSG